MKMPRQLPNVITSCALAGALVLGVGVLPAHAGPIQNFKDCTALGGSIKACCAGAGGTYSKDSNGAEVCVITETKTAELQEPQRPTNLIAIQIPPGVLRIWEIGPATTCDPNTVGCIQ
jgi:hypothetical protein